MECILFLFGVDFRLSESLLTASRASEAVAYRKACADSLRLAGRIWLEMADKDVQFSRNLFQVHRPETFALKKRLVINGQNLT